MFQPNFIEILNPAMKITENKDVDKPENVYYLCASHYQKCPFCGFKGIMSYTKECWECGNPLIYCPKCHNIQCTRNPFDIFEWRKTNRKNAKIYETEIFEWRIENDSDIITSKWFKQFYDAYVKLK